ncbi:DNA polymerase epsilon subunit 3-like [Gigantopelta aegis]|uniref:DNA polymerase epsilon subunit 3-like n=1 Tax=Gigantopelta aegis TaxID=1735272 RepID=UPI001B8897F4|nr:DNA polymerase epsilon subunit 3-like [Gigantopelta aegis]
MAERPEDLNLPNAVVARIIKDAIPEGVNVSKEARLAISKAASVFILYATSCSNNFAMKGKRKTISAQDVISAMEDMEFEQFCDPLKTCLEAYRSEQKGKRDKKKERDQNVSGDASITDSATGDTQTNGTAVLVSDEDSEGCDVVTEPREGEDFIITVNGEFDNDDDENSVEEIEDGEDAV